MKRNSTELGLHSEWSKVLLFLLDNYHRQNVSSLLIHTMRLLNLRSQANIDLLQYASKLPLKILL